MCFWTCDPSAILTPSEVAKNPLKGLTVTGLLSHYRSVPGATRVLYRILAEKILAPTKVVDESQRFWFYLDYYK